ncbi:OmpA family protein [Acinetobacter sp. CFCC 10889]|uniref:OmpA family protein n=1 Tax=Acinetobacter sp. CFCC 10889 TaxID=1775557 RepID=UPI002AF6C2A4|nr:OmpA family protein [Acinetobacter sp. CFCC 10889]
MDLISLLKERVIPIVLKGETTDLTEKSTALAEFFPFLLAILKGKPSLISLFQNNLNPRLSDLFNTRSELKDQFLASVSQQVPQDEIEHLLNRSIPATLNVLEDEAGSHDPTVIQHFLEQNHADIGAGLAPWAKAILAALGLGTLAGTANVTSQPVASPTHAPIVEEQKKSNFWLPLIALLILLFLAFWLLRSCKNNESTAPVTATENTANVNQQPAYFQISTDHTGGLVTCQAKIGDPSFIDILQKEVKQIFTHENGCGADSSRHFNAALVDQNSLVSVLKLLKGVPNVSMIWTGNQITLQGADTAALQALADKIKPLAKDVQVVVEQPAVLDENTAVTSSVDKAKEALSQIDPNQVKPLDIATALNLQIINFASASADIPDVNKSVLDQASVLMNKVQNVQLVVKGYTDATGNAAANKTLSQKRAKSVVDYLVSKGVDPSKLQAQGFGQENPVADNATKEGQFKNRRIEFEVINTETGTVRTVDEQGVEKTN